MVLHEAIMTWKRFPLNWEHTVAQIIELTEIWDVHVTPLKWTYFLRNISFSAPEGLSDRISMGKQMRQVLGMPMRVDRYPTNIHLAIA